jgi:peptide methionine sulfoxide reductase MsrA
VTELATFGAGCFWGVEVTFRNTHGVKDAIVGYLGGTLANPALRSGVWRAAIFELQLQLNERGAESLRACG